MDLVGLVSIFKIDFLKARKLSMTAVHRPERLNIQTNPDAGAVLIWPPYAPH